MGSFIQFLIGLGLLYPCYRSYSYYIDEFKKSKDLWLSEWVIYSIAILCSFSVILFFLELFKIFNEKKLSVEKTQSKLFNQQTLREITLDKTNLSVHDIHFDYSPDFVETLKFLIGTFFIIGLLGSFVGIGETVSRAVSQLTSSDSSDMIKKIIEPLSKLQIVFGVSIAGLLTALTIENFLQIIYREILNLELLVTSEVKNNALNIMESKKDYFSTLDELLDKHNKNQITELKSIFLSNGNENNTDFNNLWELFKQNQINQKEALKDLFVFKNELENEIVPSYIFRELHKESVQQTKAMKSFSSDLSDGLNISDQTLVDLKKHQNELFDKYFVFKTENNDSIFPADFFRESIKNSNQQTKSLKAFSSDLADSMKVFSDKITDFFGDQFVEILNKPFNENLAPALDKLENAINHLKNAKEESSSAVIEKVISNLQSSLSDMGSQFQQSLSGSANEQIDNLVGILSKSSQSLSALPEQMNSMMGNLDLQVAKIKETMAESLLVSKESSSKQIEESNKLFSEIVSNLRNEVLSQQKSSDFISSKMTENAQIATKVMSEYVQNSASEFGNTIKELQENMKSVINVQNEKTDIISSVINQSLDLFENSKNLVSSINVSISNLSGVISDISKVSEKMLSTSDNLEESGNLFKESSNNLSNYSNEFVKGSQKNIIEIRDSLELAKNVAEDYSRKFSVIQNGLTSIFNQVQSGLVNYQQTTKTSLNTYLSDFTKELEKGAKSLSSGIDLLNEAVENMSDMIQKDKGYYKK